PSPPPLAGAGGKEVGALRRGRDDGAWRAEGSQLMATRGGPLSVPLCDLQAQYRELRAELEARVTSVLASGQVTVGPEVAGREAEIAQYWGVARGVGCASGSAALLLALQALDLGPGDEVLLPPFPFFATAGAVCRAGARPVFADIDPETWNLD